MTQPASYTFPFERERESESHHEIFQQLSSPRSLFHVAAKKRRKCNAMHFDGNEFGMRRYFARPKSCGQKMETAFDILPKYLQICKT